MTAEDAAMRAREVLATALEAREDAFAGPLPVGLWTGSGHERVLVEAEDTPAPQVDFDAKHAKEDFDRLKFNFLGLSSKAAFMRKLLSSADWAEGGAGRWAPGEVARFERETTSVAKDALRAEKTRTAALREAIAELAERAVDADGALDAESRRLSELLGAYDADVVRAAEMAAAVPEEMATRRTASDLRGELDDAGIALERNEPAMARARASLAELERLRALCDAEEARVSAELGAVRAEAASLSGAAPASAARETTRQLCEWYASASAALGRIAEVSSVELVRADYMVVRLARGGTQLHVFFGAGEGALRVREVRVGHGGATPRSRALRDVCDTAVAMDDVPYAVRAVLALLPQ